MTIQLLVTVLAVEASSAIFGMRVSRMKAAINRRFDEVDGRFDGLTSGPDDSLRACFTRWNDKMDRFAENLETIRQRPN